MTNTVMTGNSLHSVIQASSDMVRESAEMKKRVWNTISASTEIIDRSRRLLSLPLVSGIPELTHLEVSPATSDDSQVGSGMSDSRQPPVRPRELHASPERIEGQSFVEATVRLDGRHFVDCIVENCVLEYWGGPVILEGTQFSGCRFSFGGEAAMTLSVLDCFGLYNARSNSSTKASGASPSSARVN